jgi:hypothetical protein
MFYQVSNLGLFRSIVRLLFNLKRMLRGTGGGEIWQMTKKEDELKESEDFEPPSMTEKDEKVIEEIEEIPVVESTSEQKQTGFVWTPEVVKDLQKFLVEFLGTNLADKYLSHRKIDAEAQRRYFDTVSNHNRRMIYVLLAFLIGIVGFMSFLTLYESVSGDALLFLVGTITGYVLLFIQRLVFPSKERPPTEEETPA